MTVTIVLLGLVVLGVIAFIVLSEDPYAEESPEQRRLRIAREAHARRQLRAGVWTTTRDKEDS